VDVGSPSRALVVIGDGNGKVGPRAYGKAKEVGLALQNGYGGGLRENLFEVPLAGTTIVHPVIGETGVPASRHAEAGRAPGTGVIAGAWRPGPCLEMAGVRGILRESTRLLERHQTSPTRPSTACSSCASPKTVAKARGKSLDEVMPSGTLHAYRERQREGDLFKIEAHATMSQLKVTQIRSAIGTKPKHRGTLRALGLRKIGQSNVLPDRPEIRGMIARVPHLIDVQEVN
jgi:ribosomal protein L30